MEAEVLVHSAMNFEQHSWKLMAKMVVEFLDSEEMKTRFSLPHLLAESLVQYGGVCYI